MTYELWDADGGNCIGAHRTESAALRVVATLVRQHGRDSREVRSLGLVAQDGEGDGRLVAEGESLVVLALTANRAEISA